MDVSFDIDKRDVTLEQRRLDFGDSGKVFAGRTSTLPDTRREYGEDRFISIGDLHDRSVVLVWTPRHGTRRIISMRHTHADERARRRRSLD